LRRASLLAVAVLALAACARPAGDASGPLLPDLAARLPTLQGIELRTAGDRVAVTLDRKPSGWTVRERTGWPADPAAMRALLEDLAGARRVEAKTAKPDRYARIGVEPVSGADAGGVEVRLRGKDWSEAVVIGHVPPVGAGRLVRVSAQAQAWQVDRVLDVPREPAAWLDTKLLDVPLAHVVGVGSRDDAGHAYALSHRDDRFRIVDAPSAAMGDSYRGDTVAGVLEDLHIDDVAVDDGHAAERTVEYTLEDARVVRLEAWRVEGRVWVRVRECADSAAACPATPRWSGRRFLLPAHVAAKLWLTRDQVLGRTP
jgi:hypothetical protein